jgi:hypothetical protein
MVTDDGPVRLDGIRVLRRRASGADARIIVCATLAERLEIERLVDETLRLGDRPGAPRTRARGS